MNEPMVAEERTRGEVLVDGLTKMREGLQMLQQIGRPLDLVGTILGSQRAAQHLREVLADDSILLGIVTSMVAARNSRLAIETARKIINDLLDVLFDLSRPVVRREVEEVAGSKG